MLLGERPIIADRIIGLFYYSTFLPYLYYLVIFATVTVIIEELVYSLTQLGAGKSNGARIPRVAQSPRRKNL